jgi:hypothetical protein
MHFPRQYASRTRERRLLGFSGGGWSDKCSNVFYSDAVTMNKYFLAITALLYNAFLLAGTAYLVGWRGWSVWTFLFTLILLVGFSLKTKAGLK